MELSIVIPTRNNLKYFKWAYQSIRKNQGNHDVWICAAADACTDGTNEYFEELSRIDKRFKFIVNDGPERLGHTILYDQIISELVTTDVAVIYHADMFLCPNSIDSIEANIKPGTIVSLTRIEPPLHPPGVEKVIANFGSEPEEFDEDKFLEWFINDEGFNEYVHNHTNKTYITEGIFAPWAFYVDDFKRVGGHDPLFAPQSREDSDIFNKFALNGYKFIQTWKGFVYHLTSRGSRFNPNITQVGTNSSEWTIQNKKSERNFIRKWGTRPYHDNYMKPMVPPRYNITFVLDNLNNIDILNFVEPYATIVHCNTLNNSEKIVEEYKSGVDNGHYSMDTRVKHYDKNQIPDLKGTFYHSDTQSDVIVYIDVLRFMDLHISLIQNITLAINDMELSCKNDNIQLPAVFEYHNIEVKVNKFNNIIAQNANLNVCVNKFI